MGKRGKRTPKERGRRRPAKKTPGKAPIGTRAPAFNGGFWEKVESGWKWMGPEGCGDVFPRPGGDWDGRLLYPEPDSPSSPAPG